VGRHGGGPIHEENVMSTARRISSTARARLRERRNQRAFQRAYEQASPTMQAELLALSQHQRIAR
jgi:hypothetical protein